LALRQGSVQEVGEAGEVDCAKNKVALDDETLAMEVLKRWTVL